MQDRNSLEDFLTRLVEHETEYLQLQNLLNNLSTNTRQQSLLQLLLAYLPFYLRQINKLNRDKYRYALEVEAFADCVTAHSIADCFYLETICRNPVIPRHGGYPELEENRIRLSHFLHDLRQRLLSPELRHEASQQQKQMNRTYRAMCQYVDNLFNHYARLVVLRVDLNYITDAQIDIEDLEQHLQRFYDSTRTLVKPTFDEHQKRTLGLFSDLKGYIFKIEYGTSKGLHVHALLFFDGSKRQGNSDWELARRIGQHWHDTIVGEQGTYWNCHDDKANYIRLGRLGIGGIHVLEQDKIANLKGIISYFCKRGQHIKPIDKPKMRLLRKGDLLAIPVVKRGAPRKELPKIIAVKA